MFVVPVTTPVDKDTGKATFEGGLWIPPGDWYYEGKIITGP